MDEITFYNTFCTKEQMFNYIHDFYDEWQLFIYMEDINGNVKEFTIIKKNCCS